MRRVRMLGDGEGEEEEANTNLEVKLVEWKVSGVKTRKQ